MSARADFAEAFAPVRAFEGGWCNVAGDAGGETYVGITKNFAPEWSGWLLIEKAKADASFAAGARAFSAHLAALPGLPELVESWYRVEWWDAMHLEELPQVLANELFEQAVNLGRSGSGRYVQRMLNALNYSGANAKTPDLFGADLVEDGVLGPKSRAALRDALSWHGAPLIVKCLNALQGAHYIDLAAGKPTQRKFLRGWMTRA